jgi:hypothetical protein
MQIPMAAPIDKTTCYQLPKCIQDHDKSQGTRAKAREPRQKRQVRKDKARETRQKRQVRKDKLGKTRQERQGRRAIVNETKFFNTSKCLHRTNQMFETSRRSNQYLTRQRDAIPLCRRRVRDPRQICPTTHPTITVQPGRPPAETRAPLLFLDGIVLC